MSLSYTIQRSRPLQSLLAILRLFYCMGFSTQNGFHQYFPVLQPIP